MAQEQPEKEIEEKQEFETLQNEDTSRNNSNAFKFNADAPEFVPRSHNTTAQIPISGYFVPCVQYVGGKGGTDWIYVSGDQQKISLVSNSTSAAASQNHPKNVLTEELQRKILKQMEYQFSDMSLLANDNLAKQINKDPEGFVPIPAVASTKKIKSLVGNNHQLLAQALRASLKLDVSTDGMRVKRKIPFTDKVKEELQYRTVVAENLPDDHSHQNIEKIFNVAGSVKTIRICHPPDPASRSKGDFVISTKLHALVEFENSESAEIAVEKLNDHRNWRKGLRVRCLLRRSPKSVLKGKFSAFERIIDDHEGAPAEVSEAPPPQPNNSDLVAANNAEESSAASKKVWGKGHGKSRLRIQKSSSRGLVSSAPQFSNSILGEAFTRQTIKGPKMPDGTRGFTMGRGKPLVAPPARSCSA